jgi:cytochrome c oxidase assembly factor CtaG
LVGWTTISSLRTTVINGVTDVSVFVSMMAQLAVALTLFHAAARKFARDDVPAFNVPLACVLLALCTLIAAVALRFWRDSPIQFGPSAHELLAVQCVSTMAALAVVAFLPVSAAARASARWARLEARDPAFRRPRPRSFLLAPVVATFIVGGVFAAVLTPLIFDLYPFRQADEVAGRLVCIAAFFFFSLVTASGLLRFSFARGDKGLWVLVLYGVLIWAVPPLADLAFEVAYDDPGNMGRSMLFGFSPVGGWVTAFGLVEAPMVPGLIFQALLAAASLVLARRAKVRTGSVRV